MRRVETIQKDIKTYEDLLSAEGLMADEKEFLKDELDGFKKELEKAEAEASSKAPAKKATAKKSTAKKAPAKKSTAKKEPAKASAKKAVAKKPKEKQYVEVDGKKVFEDDDNFCDALIESWKKRKEKAKKSAGKRKTSPVTQRISKDVADAVVKGIKNVSVKEIKDNPVKAVSQMERLEKAAKEFLEAFKDILGKTITQKDIKEEFEGLDKLISTIKDKYVTTKKMADGGSTEGGESYKVTESFTTRNGNDKIVWVSKGATIKVLERRPHSISFGDIHGNRYHTTPDDFKKLQKEGYVSKFANGGSTEGGVIGKKNDDFYYHNVAVKGKDGELHYIMFLGFDSMEYEPQEGYQTIAWTDKDGDTIEEFPDDRYRKVLEFVHPDSMKIANDFLMDVTRNYVMADGGSIGSRKVLVRDVGDNSTSEWTITELLARINEDNASDEFNYNESDWLEGFEETLEGNYYSLYTPDGRPLNDMTKMADGGIVLTAKGSKLASLFDRSNELRQKAFDRGYSKLDLMNMAYGQGFSNVDSALPLGALEQMGISPSERYRYVMDYNTNTFGEIVDLYEKIAERNPIVEVYNADFVLEDTLPINEAYEKYYRNSKFPYMIDIKKSFDNGGSTKYDETPLKKALYGVINSMTSEQMKPHAIEIINHSSDTKLNSIANEVAFGGASDSNLLALKRAVNEYMGKNNLFAKGGSTEGGRMKGSLSPQMLAEWISYNDIIVVSKEFTDSYINNPTHEKTRLIESWADENNVMLPIMGGDTYADGGSTIKKYVFTVQSYNSEGDYIGEVEIEEEGENSNAAWEYVEETGDINLEYDELVAINGIPVNEFEEKRFAKGGSTEGGRMKGSLSPQMLAEWISYNDIIVVSKEFTDSYINNPTHEKTRLIESWADENNVMLPIMGGDTYADGGSTEGGGYFVYSNDIDSMGKYLNKDGKMVGDMYLFTNREDVLSFIDEHQHKFKRPLGYSKHEPNNLYAELNRDTEVYPTSTMADGGSTK